jgi:hypothetical protein
MKVIAIENVRGVGGAGLAITVVYETFVHGSFYFRKIRNSREAFKTDGSATHWCWLEDGSPCPHEVWRAWEAYKARNLLAGRPAYTCSNFGTGGNDGRG